MFQRLPDGPLDIIGDVHGEYDALRTLLSRLGYGEDGAHPGGRHLVFLGDLVDRGPDSVAVVDHVRRLVEGGRAQVVLGNHELNLLRGQRKDGNDWFWGEGNPRDARYEPFNTLPPGRREELLSFLATLPLALERADLRIVHAAWHEPSLAAVRQQGPGSPAQLFDRWENEVERRLAEDGTLARSQEERLRWKYELGDPEQLVPLLEHTGRCDEARQMGNPIRVLTSGIERLGREPFFSSGQWRFVERVKWWDEYTEAAPVVVGHYWRRLAPVVDRARLGKGDPNLFETIAPTAWHGARGNVFCIDFSVGGRFHERRDDLPLGSTTQLAALRWPERVLVLESGETVRTTDFCGA